MIKIDFLLTLMLGDDNKRFIISILSFSMASCKAVFLNKIKILFKRIIINDTKMFDN